MKTVVLTGIRKMELWKVSNPELRNDTDVLLKTGIVGVCGTDIHYYLMERIGDQLESAP